MFPRPVLVSLTWRQANLYSSLRQGDFFFFFFLMILSVVDKQVGIAIKLYIIGEVSGSNLGGVIRSDCVLLWVSTGSPVKCNCSILCLKRL
jgi:hypothetical protein